MAKKNKGKSSSRSVVSKADGPGGGTAGLTRRGFLGSASVAGGVALSGVEARAATPRAKTLGPRKVAITLDINGKPRKLSVEPRVTLLRALRNELDLTGSKEICDRGACGGCSVIIDGNLVTSCMMLAVDAVGKKITTIEGLSQDGKMHPLQQEFVKFDALQCGFCTPGMVMACKAILDKNKKPDLVEIKKGLSGNICRCGTYTNIFKAVQSASKLV
jgi:xanthine dehydrogenase YagT iron-sulfur-binding subunit